MKRSDLVTGLKPATTVFLFAFLAVLAFACSAVAGDVGAELKPAPTDIRPIIRFDQEKVNLGKVTRGSIAEHIFSVYNDGGAPLQILELKPG